MKTPLGRWWFVMSELWAYIKVWRIVNLLESPLCRAAATAVTKQYLKTTGSTMIEKPTVRNIDGGEQVWH